MQKNPFSIDDCISYMEDKYGEPFEYIEPFDNEQPTARTLKIYVESKSYPDSKVLVVAELIGNEIVFHDNYIGIVYESKTFDTLYSLASSTYGDCKLIYSVDNIYFLPDEFNGNTGFEEYISNLNSNIRLNILLPPNHSHDRKEDELDKFGKQLCSAKIACSCNIYYTTDEAVYNAIEKSDEMYQYDNWYISNGYIKTNESYEVVETTWR